MGIQERKQREKEARRNRIIEAAKKVFLEKGIERATMKEIAQEAELSKAALYLYFKNKEELTFELLHISFSMIQDLIRQVDGDGGSGYEKLERAAAMFRQMYREQPEYIYFSLVMEQYSYSISNNLPTTQKCMQLIDEIEQSVVALLKEGIEDGSIRADLDAEKSAVLFLHMSISFIQRISMMKGIFSIDSDYDTYELVDHMFSVFLHSLV